MKEAALLITIFILFALFSPDVPAAEAPTGAITITPLSVPSAVPDGGRIDLRFSVAGGEGTLYYQAWLETWYGGQWHYPGFPGQVFMNSRTFTVTLDVPNVAWEKVRAGLFVTDSRDHQAEWRSDEITGENPGTGKEY